MRRWLPWRAGRAAEAVPQPVLLVVIAGLLAQAPGLRNALPALLLSALVMVLLLGQPDVGIALAVGCLVALQLFLAACRRSWCWAAAPPARWRCGRSSSVPARHPAHRPLHRSGRGDHYQVGLALQAVQGAAWFGSGPGEGTVKYALPDAHSDFVFAVIAEEFGLLASLALLGLFTFVLLRGLARTERSATVSRCSPRRPAGPFGCRRSSISAWTFSLCGRA